ncbi:MAG: hypothetical protein D6706_01495 [Chloroflexi bacterium]|nr:MAG: hypothetical protein D6706_01495 [Chloroflexota bacterium]
MSENPIELAYRAKSYVPGQAYRRGQRRKMYNPIRTTPALIQAMLHLGEKKMTLPEARRRARRAVQEPEADEYINKLDWPGLLDFLDTIAVFLKAGPQKRKEKGMREFKPAKETLLTSEQITMKAINLAGLIPGDNINNNKLKKMGAHITAARDRWEALAGLARFYPRKGIPQKYVNALVELLETTDLRSFKQVVAQSLIFYEANQIKERRGN